MKLEVMCSAKTTDWECGTGDKKITRNVEHYNRKGESAGQVLSTLQN